MKINKNIIILTIVIAILLFSTSVYASWNYKDAAEPYKGQTIRIISFIQESSEVIKETIPKFEKETGIKVDFSVVPFTQLHEKIAFSLNKGDYAYDLVAMAVINSKEYEAAGWVRPIEPFVLNDKLTNPEFDLADFYPGFIGDMQGIKKYEGEQPPGKPNELTIYGLPINTNTVMLAYRTDLFEQAGLTGPPKTYEELLDYARKLHNLKPGVSGIAIRARRGQGDNIFIFPIIGLAFGGRWFTEDYKPAFNEKPWVDALKYWVKLQQYNIAGLPTWAEVQTAFGQGLAAMAMDSSNFAGLWAAENSKIYGKVKFAPVPYNKDTKFSFSAHAAHGLAIAKTAKYPEAAWLFLQYVLETENLIPATIKVNMSASVKKSVTKSKEFLEKFSWEGFVKSSDWGYAHSPEDFRPVIPEWRQIGDNLGLAVEQATIGDKSPEEALNWAANQASEILEEAGYYKEKKKYPWKWPYGPEYKVTEEDINEYYQ